LRADGFSEKVLIQKITANRCLFFVDNEEHAMKRKGRDHRSSNNMNRQLPGIFASIKFSLALAAATILLAGVQANAQCTEVTTGLRQPLGTALTNKGNLLVSETGTTNRNSGRISIVEPNGNRRTLLDGVPSALNDVGDPSGPAGLFMRGRHLYVVIGNGDVGIPGPRPGTALENPNGPSSPIFSSILAIHFSAATEKKTSGFTLTFADQTALAEGQTVRLSNGGGDKMTIQLIVNFPNFIPRPLPDVPNNIELSNPFQLVAVDDMLYVTDGGRNLVWQVDLPTRTFSPLVVFPSIPNPFFPALGGPFIQAVPTGIASFKDKLLVTLFRGAPFPTGVSTVELIDPTTGSDTPFITGLTTAIDILPIKDKGETSYLVLESSSAGPFFSGSGEVLLYHDPAGSPVLVANCLTLPTSMTLDRKTGRLYVSEAGGRIVAIPLP
jgi:hypothetical protein